VVSPFFGISIIHAKGGGSQEFFCLQNAFPKLPFGGQKRDIGGFHVDKYPAFPPKSTEFPPSCPLAKKSFTNGIERMFACVLLRKSTQKGGIWSFPHLSTDSLLLRLLSYSLCLLLGGRQERARAFLHEKNSPRFRSAQGGLTNVCSCGIIEPRNGIAPTCSLPHL